MGQIERTRRRMRLLERPHRLHLIRHTERRPFESVERDDKYDGGDRSDKKRHDGQPHRLVRREEHPVHFAERLEQEGMRSDVYRDIHRVPNDSSDRRDGAIPKMPRARQPDEETEPRNDEYFEQVESSPDDADTRENERRAQQP